MIFFSENHRKWWVLTGVSIASFLGCIDFTIVNTALPAIRADLHATVAELQWIINIFLLALSAFMVVMGRMADIYGRRRVLYLGAICFGLASLGAGLVTNINWLIAFRFAQGVSCAVLYTASGAIVSNAFPEEERGKGIGLLFGVNGLGLAIGPVIGGIIVSTLGWRWIFLINVPLIVLSLLICTVSVKESRNEEQGTTLDWGGLIFLITGLSACIVVLSLGSEWGWLSFSTLGLLIISVVALVIFYHIEQRVSAPILQLHLFKNRTFIGAAIANAALAFFYCLAFFLMPLYLHTIKDLEGYQIGMMLLPTTAMVALLSPIVGRLTDRMGVKIILVSGFLFFAISAFLQTLFSEYSSLFSIAIAFTLMGIGWACVLGPSTVAALSSVPERMGAVAMGSSWTVHNIGGAVGLAFGLLLYQQVATSSLLLKLGAFGVTPGQWVERVIAEPEGALSALHQHAGLDLADALNVFHTFFIEGYRAAMGLLLAISLSVLCILWMTLKRQQSKQ
ncbi:MFS transporter [Photorhabdus luminescens]|nr:MFS transporter [Photorhabdus luminescens]